MDVTLRRAKRVALMAQYLTDDHCNAALVSMIRETTAILKHVEGELLVLLLSVMANGGRNDHELDAS